MNDSLSSGFVVVQAVVPLGCGNQPDSNDGCSCPVSFCRIFLGAFDLADYAKCLDMDQWLVEILASPDNLIINQMPR